MENNVRTPAADLAAIEALEKLREEMVAKLPEHVFVNKFLPLFASKENTNTDLSDWLDVCVNAYLPVDVVGRNGEVLFRVPPLIKQVPTKVTARGQDSIFEVIETAAKKTAINPVLGSRYLESHLDARIDRLKITKDEVDTWNHIFTRYGYPPLVEVSVDSETTTPEKSSDDLFSDGYEEL